MRAPRRTMKRLSPSRFTTPTGAGHPSTAPPLPGLVVVDVSELEVRIGVMIAAHAAYRYGAGGGGGGGGCGGIGGSGPCAAKLQLSGFLGEYTTGINCPIVGQALTSTTIR